MTALLAPYRVLDLTDERGLLASKMLADLGAEVVAVEPPGGSVARRGRWCVDPQRGESPEWTAFAAGKRSVTCAMTTEEGRALLRRLVVAADFVFDTAAPAEWAAVGLGHDDLLAINPALVHVSISAFGQDGPKAGYADTDLIVWASAGPLLMSQDGDRPPVRLTLPQAFQHACADAAVGAMVAHFARVRTGRGQHVDVSAQQSSAQATLSKILSACVEPPGGPTKLSEATASKWEVQDGYIEMTMVAGTSLGHFTNHLTAWMVEEGQCDEGTAAVDWSAIILPSMPYNVAGAPVLAEDEYERIKGVVAAFLRTKTKHQMMEQALERKLLLAPLLDVADVVNNPHLADRAFWLVAEGEDDLVLPRPMGVRDDGCPDVIRRSPTIGEHNADVYRRWLGLASAELEALGRARVI